MQFIRNFCIIAHIDHGKSTLADRFLEHTKTISDREKKNQLLDDMELERERGITIKSHAIQMEFKYKGVNYILNLIDTPGHVDFSHEVSRSIVVCEGALLVVDAVKSIQSQTISNLFLAIERKLTIIPIINKIDLPGANTEKVTYDIIHLIGCNANEVIFSSAKKGIGIDKILEAIICKIPNPKGNIKEPLQALIFDSFYNTFRGVEAYFKLINGQIKKGDKIKSMFSGKMYSAEEIGNLKFKHISKSIIRSGDVGYIISGIKETLSIKVGDTLTCENNTAKVNIECLKNIKPMVFAGIYPSNTEYYESLRISIEKLHLNDASFTFFPESSVFLGFGFRCGFLGMLHLEIIQERLEREYGISVITTIPNVSFKAFLKRSQTDIIWVNNPSEMPDLYKIERLEEPYIKASIITHVNYIGGIMSLCIEKRGIIKNQNYLMPQRVELIFEMPLSEVIFNFYDRLKNISKGYASFDYSPLDYRFSDIVLVNILLNHKSIDALSTLVHRSNAFYIGKKICKKLQDIIPRQQFDVSIQATIENKIIARETIKALRKDVTSKCYGGDISRKKKLLLKQKQGKKKC
jgi:GTP-binding protein LepA